MMLHCKWVKDGVCVKRHNKVPFFFVYKRRRKKKRKKRRELTSPMHPIADTKIDLHKCQTLLVIISSEQDERIGCRHIQDKHALSRLFSMGIVSLDILNSRGRG